MPRPRRKGPPVEEAATPGTTRRPLRRPEPIDPEKYPNLAAHQQLERALRVHRAMEAGMTREEAKRHADEHLSGGEPRRAKVAPMAKPPRKAVAAATKRFHKEAAKRGRTGRARGR